jgi:hypothetical protein
VVPRFTFESDGYLHGIIFKSLILPCNHVGLPEPTVLWFKDDKVKEKNSTNCLVFYFLI